jgi:RNase P subunit RPR2
MFESDIDQPKSHGRKACGACGSIMILGYEATIGLERICKRKSKETAKAIVYKCAVCNVKTRFPINAAPKSTNRPGAISKTQASSISQTDTHIQLASENLDSAASKTSRKRSKPAKQGGLKALLQKKTQDTASASDFDLMDFMKRA